jgi:hypothetical protein
MLVGVNNAIGGVFRPSAVCVMHDDEILNPKEMLRDGNLPQSVNCTPTRHHDRR